MNPLSLFYQKSPLSQGGTRTRLSEQRMKDYDVVVCRPRWLMAFGCMMFAAFSGIFFAAVEIEDGWELWLLGTFVASLFGLGALFCFSETVFPKKWKFLFALGPRGLLLRKGYLRRSYWLYPWTEVEAIERTSEAGHRVDCIYIYFSHGMWRYSATSFINVRKRITPLVDKYKNQLGHSTKPAP